MPTTFDSYDTDGDGVITADEWASYQPQGGAGGGFDVNEILDFFAQITGAFEGSGFEFTPEMLESFGVILPAMGMYSEFAKAEYQQDALDFMREEMGLKEQELALAKDQLAFESGPAWDWYKNHFFPATQEAQRYEWETQRHLADNQRALSDNQLLLGQQMGAQELSQGKERTRQAEIASEIARYNALAQIGLGRATRSADGRRVRGSAFTYGYGN